MSNDADAKGQAFDAAPETVDGPAPAPPSAAANADYYEAELAKAEAALANAEAERAKHAPAAEDKIVEATRLRDELQTAASSARAEAAAAPAEGV
jgi:hypothetical protein